MDRVRRHAAYSARAAVLAAAALLAACASFPGGGTAARVYERETFDRAAAFSREFVASPADTCNAARRALLSQGYIVTATGEEQMEARKRFQPGSDEHVQIEFHVVCSPLARGQRNAIAFVSAVQERYTVKKNPMSASVGVSPIGSISLPLASAADSLIKVGSETIPPGRFYDRFFDLVEQFLAEQKGLDESVPNAVQPAGSPTSRAAGERSAGVPITMPTPR
ncbi:MAG: hypothetical protein RJA99_4945 [Pseudomonadota bacterium]|jgi:hypothetical protein